MCQGNYFAFSVKINFCYRQTKCVDDQDEFHLRVLKSFSKVFIKSLLKSFSKVSILSIAIYSSELLMICEGNMLVRKKNYI